MAANPQSQPQLLANLGGSQLAVNQMNNAYGPGGQNYRPWLSALADKGLSEPSPGAMAQNYANEGYGHVDASGKWVWNPGMGWDVAQKSVY